MQDRRDTLRRYVATARRGRELADSDDMFAAGVATSLFAMQLVVFLEKEFGVRFDHDDLKIEHLGSIDAICELLERKAGQHVSSAHS